MVDVFFGAAREVAAVPKIEPSCLFKRSICSLIAAARRSCPAERSCVSMGRVDIQKVGEKSMTARRL